MTCLPLCSICSASAHHFKDTFPPTPQTVPPARVDYNPDSDPEQMLTACLHMNTSCDDSPVPSAPATHTMCRPGPPPPENRSRKRGHASTTRPPPPPGSPG
ncbi:hypothetical protein OBBRIDRAFT_46550 [Obba rivulosa]|uniref:Uncharacterized protein n=1 Tax=Obba rivulosa TaxID=1052685 RepID=A0A8E2AVR0_9APHY|nr:hypothetical protein OBBRIDRAFT_46550 [Obba rivulosa]